MSKRWTVSCNCEKAGNIRFLSSAADAENAAEEETAETAEPAQEPEQAEQAPEEDGGDAIEPDEDKKEDGEQN